jgi:hypothetical protein
MRDKFRDNPANSDRFHADYCYIGTVSAASSIWRILGSGRRAGTLRGAFTTQKRDGDGVHRGE